MVSYLRKKLVGLIKFNQEHKKFELLENWINAVIITYCQIYRIGKVTFIQSNEKSKLKTGTAAARA